MNHNEAYQTCHELMLINPNYVACESANLTYMLVQISDRDEAIGIHAFLVNPEIPEDGSIRQLADMTEDQQISVLSLSPVAKTIKTIHEKIMELKRLSQDTEKRDECIKKLQKLINH